MRGSVMRAQRRGVHSWVPMPFACQALAGPFFIKFNISTLSLRSPLGLLPDCVTRLHHLTLVSENAAEFGQSHSVQRLTPLSVSLGHRGADVRGEQISHSRSHQHERGEQPLARRLQHHRHANAL